MRKKGFLGKLCGEFIILLNKIIIRQDSMKYVFISGIPASGKSYLAAKVAKTLDIQHFKIDDWREKFSKEKHADWVDFFWNKNEEDYWGTTSCEEHWNNTVKQSEALWTEILSRIDNIIRTGKPAIFEGVNILAHLAHRDLNFKGIFLLGESFEIILERNKQDPRWGQTEELQRKEAEVFYNCEGPKYKKEAEKYGFKTFIDPSLAEKELFKILRRQK